MRRIALLGAALAMACSNTPLTDYSVVLSPSTATITAGKTLQLGAISKGAVTWSVTESGGGAVDANGVYTTPPTAGTYHVVATSASDKTKSATATITVVPAPQQPTLTAPRLLTLGKTGTVTAGAQAGMTFAWSIFGGTLNATTGASVTFTASDVGEVLLGATATNAAGDSSSEALAITTSIAAATTPTISAPLALTTGRAGMTASVLSMAGITYAWTIANGAITGGAATNAVTFTAGSTGVMTLTVVASNAAGDAAPSSTATIQVHPASVLELTAGAVGGIGNADDKGGDARFFYPLGLAADSAGNTYVADENNSLIRKVAPDGTVTTVAGIDGQTPGYNGDHAGTATLLYYPSSLAVDGTGAVWISDSSNCRVRKLAGGNVTTIAGSGACSSVDGDGTAASIAVPGGIAVRPDGQEAWVSDNVHLRRITENPDGGPMQVGTPAGFAAMNYAYGITVDSLSDVFVSEYNNYTVREAVDAGFIANVTGTAASPGFVDGLPGTALFNYNQGIAFDPSTSALFVADSNNRAIRRLDYDAGSFQWLTTTVTGGPDAGTDDGPVAAARWNYPAGIAAPGDGSLIVSDELAQTIRRISGGNVTTIAGRAAQRGHLDGPALAARFETSLNGSEALGVAVDQNDNTYVTDNSFIRRISPDGVVTTFAGTGDSIWMDGLAGNASFSFPEGLAWDGKNQILYVVDNGSQTLRTVTYDPAFGAEVVSTISGAPNNCLSNDNASDALDAGFCGPTGVGVDSQGRVFVADSDNNKIRMLQRTPDGGGYSITTIAGYDNNGCAFVDMSGHDAGLCGPAGLTVDSQDRIFVADNGNSAIRQIVESGGSWAVTTIAGYDNPVAAQRCGFQDAEGADAGFCGPAGIAADARGNLWVSELTNGTIRQLTFDTGTSKWAVSTPFGAPRVHGVKPGAWSSARLNAPGGLAVTPYGDVVVVDGQENSVLLVRPP